MIRRQPAQPPIGPWPAEMRAPTAAAYFDFPDTGELFGAIGRGEAPRPTSLRGKKREPTWAKSVCESFIARRHQVNDDASGEGADDVASLI